MNLVFLIAICALAVGLMAGCELEARREAKAQEYRRRILEAAKREHPAGGAR